jgi:hypothetical protein
MRAESLTIPPKIKSAPPSLAIFACMVFGFAIAGAGAFVFFFNPATHGFYPVCLFHKLTGLNCPGCGATRSLYALLHGNFPLALRDNALFVFTLAALALRGAWFATKKKSRKAAGNFIEPEFLWAFLIVALAFGVLRNLAAFSFLSP